MLLAPQLLLPVQAPFPSVPGAPSMQCPLTQTGWQSESCVHAPSPSVPGCPFAQCFVAAGPTVQVLESPVASGPRLSEVALQSAEWKTVVPPSGKGAGGTDEAMPPPM